MSVGFAMQSVAGKGKRDARITGRYLLETRMLLDFAEAANGRTDQPEDSLLDWIEGGGQDDDDPDSGPVSPRDCYPAEEVLSGLRWLRELAAAGDKTAQSVWRREWRMKEPFSADAFMKCIKRDLDGLINFCDQAKQRGEKVIGVSVS